MNPERLSDCRMFARLDAAARAELAERAVERRFPAGHVIVTEGELADRFYVVLEGSAQVYIERSGAQIVLARIEAGEQFGEQALVPGRTGYRSASVRALTEVALAEFPASVLRRQLAAAPELTRELRDLGNAQLRADMRLKCEAIRFLDFDADDFARMGSEHFAPGQLLMKQGGPSDKLYLVVSGELEVYEERGARQRILHKLCAGQCVGELGLVTRKPRTASVRAISLVETVAISAAHFHELLERSAGLRNHVRALRRCMSLREEHPGAADGFLTQYAGHHDGAECVTTAYRMEDGRHVIASLLSESGRYHVDVNRPSAASAPSRTLRHPAEGTAACEIVLGETLRIESATAEPEWPDLQQLHRLILEDAPWSGALIEGFLRDGRLAVAKSAAVAGDPNLLCSCMHVTYQQGIDAILSGCGDLAELGRATGCGTVCGGCRPRLLPLFGDPSCAPAELEEVVPLTSGIRAFRLRAREGLSAPHGAGQHVLVEGFIGGYWVKRSYTLSSAKAASGLYEISVKLLPRGVFSPWLFERKPGDRGLRISAPRGDALPLGKLVCLVAGIGVTPALALWRQLAASAKGAAPAGFIHYSAHTAAQAAWLAELQSLAARHPGLLLTLRETSREGRLSRNDLRALAARFPESSFFLCGPETYLDEIRAALLAAGVAPNRIHEERFTPAGAPVAKPVPFWRRLFRTNRT